MMAWFLHIRFSKRSESLQNPARWLSAHRLSEHGRCPATRSHPALGDEHFRLLMLDGRIAHSDPGKVKHTTHFEGDMSMKPRLRLLVLMSVVALGASSVDANAVAITPGVSAYDSVGFYDTSTNNQLQPPVSCSLTSSPGTTVSCNGTTSSPTTSAQLQYQTTATADYGILKAGGTSSISIASNSPNTTDYSSSFGNSYFQDVWTITGGTGTGTLDLQFALDGSYNTGQVNTGTIFGFSLINFDNFAASSGASITPLISSGSGTFSTNVSLTTPFTFGTPLHFRVNLQAGSDIYDLGTNGLTSSLNLSNTAQMNAIVVKDSSGNVIPFDLTTGSGGTLFSQLAPGTSSSAVPEPGTIFLLGVGLIGLGFARRKQATKIAA